MLTQLPAPLQALAAFDQFILWTISERDGKPVKLPIGRDYNLCSVTDPSAYMSADEAFALSHGDYHVGFVFTAADPFFFFDLDKCRDGDGWSPMTNALVGRFSDACVEVSQSHNGLHVFGTYTDIPPHAMKNVDLGIELYHEKRFVALTGINIIGDASTDHTPALAALVAEFFPKKTADVSDEWNDEPIAEWDGPTNDEVLLSVAITTRSARSVFGASASFRDLFTANAEVLSRVYPSDNDAGYNESSADAALASHLAFWTGCHHERIERIMLASALNREKWEKRPKYVRDTIIEMCGRQENVFKQYRVTADTEAPATTDTHAPTLKIGYQYCTGDAQMQRFQDCTYITDIHRVMMPDGSFLRQEQFKVKFGGMVYALDATNDKTTKNAWEAFTESQAVEWFKADGLIFKPVLPSRAVVVRDGRNYINSYVPADVPSVEGDVSPFLKHLSLVLPNDRDQQILTSYMAAMVQNIGVKFQWAVVLQGVMGNGKTLFARCMSQALGPKFFYSPKATELDNKFNGWIANTLLVNVEEIRVTENRAEVMEILKTYITAQEEGIEIQFKGADQYKGEICCNFMFSSNYKNCVIKSESDRRYAVFYTAQQTFADLTLSGMSGDYFPELYKWLKGGGYANVTHYLQNYAIPDELNPATACHRAPDTTSTQEVVAQSLGAVEQRILEACKGGVKGFRGAWIASSAFDRVIVQHSRAITPARRHSILESLGYVQHPQLVGGQSPAFIEFEECAPILYIHESRAQEVLDDVVGSYRAAQVSLDTTVNKV